MAIRLSHEETKGILGEYADQGYFLLEYEDHVVTVNYKDEEEENGSRKAELGAYPQTAKTTTPEALRDCCRRHKAKLATPVGAPQ